MMNEQEYAKLWEGLTLEVTMISKTGKCKHELGECHVYASPYAKPQGVCNALLHVLDLYTWRSALGFPSFEADDRNIFRIHCPSKNGTVWKLKKLVK